MRALVPLLFCSLVSAQSPSAKSRADLGRDLAAQLKVDETSKDRAEERLARLQTAGAELATALGAGSLVAQQLRAATTEPAKAPPVEAQLQSLRRQLAQVAADLRFEPVREAPVPEQWPAPAPVGDVVVKQYPAYRMAQAPMRAEGDMSAFWKLFQHIQSNDIPMTAPVQMDHAPAKQGEIGERTAMAFLYEKGDRGKSGAQGNVEVVDVAAATYVSIGARGYETPDSIEEMTTSLRAWLAQHAPRYEVAGPMRVMGWNSPSVRGERRFYEVELPVRLRREV